MPILSAVRYRDRRASLMPRGSSVDRPLVTVAVGMVGYGGGPAWVEAVTVVGGVLALIGYVSHAWYFRRRGKHRQ